MNKTIIMFDMDGTLTEPRQAFEEELLGDSLQGLLQAGAHIGIITGSDEDYLREQMGTFLYNNKKNIHLLPCNGTKYFKPPDFNMDNHELVHEVSMEKHLGINNYRKLMQELIYSQVDMANEGVPLTGHFINCRGSMINWSPIGRNANNSEREEFVLKDAETGLRDRVISELRSMLKLKALFDKITIKLGGDTSFDIYPTGWDKTYGLKHFRKWNVWFVGDRCSPSGNDYELYEACMGQSYVSSGPEHTKEIINCILDRLEKTEEK